MKSWVLVIAMVSAISVTATEDRETEKRRMLSQNEQVKTEWLSAQDSATLVIYYKSGAVQTIRFDGSFGTLTRIVDDFTDENVDKGTAKGAVRSYQYRSLNSRQAQLAVDFGAVEGISLVEQ